MTTTTPKRRPSARLMLNLAGSGIGLGVGTSRYFNGGHWLWLVVAVVCGIGLLATIREFDKLSANRKDQTR